MSSGIAEKGSRRDIQMLFNNERNKELLNKKLTECFKQKTSIKEWLSPIAEDEYREYQDAGFLQRIGLEKYSDMLVDKFWPKGGPVWDGLAKLDDGTILLFEAKAHISELFGIGMQAKSIESRGLALNALKATAEFIHAVYDDTAWTDAMYQTANRLAHVYFLNQIIQDNMIKAKVIYLIFLNDPTVRSKGETQEKWETAINVAEQYILKLPKRKGFQNGSYGSWKDWMKHIFIDVNEMVKF